MSGSSRGGFSVTISATDNASKAIAGINKRFAEMQAPAQRLGREFNKLGSNIGLRDIGTAVKDLSVNFEKVAALAGRTAAPFAALAGAGGVAGVVSLARSWANFGSNLYLSSQQAGVSVSTLQGLGNAAQIAGGSADAATSSFVDLNKNIQLARAGHGDANFMAGLGSLGIDWQKENSSQIMDQVLHKLAQMHNVQQQLYYGNAILGGSFTQLWPVVSQGTDALNQYLNQGQQVGTLSEQQAQQAMQLRMQFERLQLSVMGLGNDVVSDLDPAINQTTGGMQGWLDANRQWLAQDISDRIREIAKATNDNIGAIGGWKNASSDLLEWWGAKFAPGILGPLLRADALLRALGQAGTKAGIPGAQTADDAARGAVWGAGIGSVVPGIGTVFGGAVGAGVGALWNMDPFGLNDVTPNQIIQNAKDRHKRLAQGMSYFESQGWSQAQSAGIMGNFTQESSLNPAAGAGTAHEGLGQWDATRRAQILAGTGIDVWNSKTSYSDQLAAAQWELTHTQSKAATALRGARTPDQAAVIFNDLYERSGDTGMPLMNRITYADQAYATPLSSPVEGVPQPSAVTHTVKGQANVRISLEGASPGVRVRSTATGDLFDTAPTVEMPMPAGGAP